MFAPSELLWALIGLILTIGSTWLEAFGLGMPPPGWQEGGAEAAVSMTVSLGVTFQVGAALFTGCMGGKNAAALSQIAYVLLGVALYERFGFQVFTQGAGFAYSRAPEFGYLLGFIPAGWLCGKLAFGGKPTLERLGFSALGGLVVVHLCGLSYLLTGSLVRWIEPDLPLLSSMMKYSVMPLPGQAMVACAIALIAYGLRKALFY